MLPRVYADNNRWRAFTRALHQRSGKSWNLSFVVIERTTEGSAATGEGDAFEF